MKYSLTPLSDSVFFAQKDRYNILHLEMFCQMRQSFLHDQSVVSQDISQRCIQLTNRRISRIELIDASV